MIEHNSREFFQQQDDLSRQIRIQQMMDEERQRRELFSPQPPIQAAKTNEKHDEEV